MPSFGLSPFIGGLNCFVPARGDSQLREVFVTNRCLVQESRVCRFGRDVVCLSRKPGSA
jgi:hypothetical protein